MCDPAFQSQEAAGPLNFENFTHFTVFQPLLFYFWPFTSIHILGGIAQLLGSHGVSPRSHPPRSYHDQQDDHVLFHQRCLPSVEVGGPCLQGLK